MKKEYRNSIRTKKMIRSAFAELIGEKKMISDISVLELAERADIAKSTFYNHYEDVYAVADEMMNELMANLNSIIEAMVSDKYTDYREYLMNIFAFLKQNEALYKKLCNSPDAVYFIDKIKFVVSRKALSVIKSPYLSQNKNERLVQISFFCHACVDIMVDYLRGNLDMTFDELQNTVMQILDKMAS